MGGLHKEQASKLMSYEPNPASESDQEGDDSSYCASSSGSFEDSNDSDQAELGPIYKSWCVHLSILEDFVQVATNFTIARFKALWVSVQDIICSKWNVGSGRQNDIHPMDVLLMVLKQLKQGIRFDQTARWLGCSGN